MHKDALWFQVFMAALTGTAVSVSHPIEGPRVRQVVDAAIQIADIAVARMKLEEVKP